MNALLGIIAKLSAFDNLIFKKVLAVSNELATINAKPRNDILCVPVCLCLIIIRNFSTQNIMNNLFLFQSCPLFFYVFSYKLTIFNLNFMLESFLDSSLFIESLLFYYYLFDIILYLPNCHVQLHSFSSFSFIVNFVFLSFSFLLQLMLMSLSFIRCQIIHTIATSYCNILKALHTTFIEYMQKKLNSLKYKIKIISRGE